MISPSALFFPDKRFLNPKLRLFGASKEERLLAVTEGEPSALLAECVNAITGDLHLAEQDVIVQGYVSLRSPRHYLNGAGEGMLAGWEFIDHLEVKYKGGVHEHEIKIR